MESLPGSEASHSARKMEDQHKYARRLRTFTAHLVGVTREVDNLETQVSLAERSASNAVARG